MCSAIFLDLVQAFDWHEGLTLKAKEKATKIICTSTSYISGRMCRAKQEQYSHMRDINAGVPEGSVLRPLIPLL